MSDIFDNDPVVMARRRDAAAQEKAKLLEWDTKLGDSLYAELAKEYSDYVTFTPTPPEAIAEYAAAFRPFVEFCKLVNASYMPATPAIVAAYLHSLSAEKVMAAYQAINYAHRGSLNPCDEELVLAVVRKAKEDAAISMAKELFDERKLNND